MKQHRSRGVDVGSFVDLSAHELLERDGDDLAEALDRQRVFVVDVGDDAAWTSRSTLGILTEMERDPMGPRALDGTERFHDATGALAATVSDFWRWAYSDLVSNSNRALVAEYLVARALGATTRPRVEWDAVDVVFEGIKVEVKCAGYVQTWSQKKPSTIRFDIANKLSWDAATNTSATLAARSADVYVFCVHAHRERETLDVLDLSQWELYVLPRRVLDEKLAAQKRANLATLVRIGANKVPYELLAESVSAAAR